MVLATLSSAWRSTTPAGGEVTLEHGKWLASGDSGTEVVVLEAMVAFKKVAGLTHIVQATPDDRAKFQTDALKLPKNWRREFPK